VIFFPTKKKNLIFYLKTVQTGSYKVEIEAEAGAGAETTATLVVNIH
jgi:hypothetical protein